MATIKLKGVVERPNKDGTTRFYRRITERVNGKQRVTYATLPHLSDPNFATELAKINSALRAPVPQREAPQLGTISALIKDFRATLPHREGKKGEKLSKSSIDNWNTYLKQIEADHGRKIVAELETHHLKKIQNGMLANPGKCNAYMSRFKVLLQFGADEGWIKFNPATNLGTKKTGENLPWPGTVIAEVLERADRQLRLAIVSGLCSGLRISDIIKMRESWIKPGPILEVPPSVKTNTEAFVPMHARWIEEIEAAKAASADMTVRPLTLLHLQNGESYKTPNELQKALRKIMRDLGYIARDDQGRPLDKDGQPVTKEAGNNPDALYSFHGLSKNAICYLAELGLDDNTIGAIVGKTAQTVRHYSKQKRLLMIAKLSAGTVIAGHFDKLVSGELSIVGER